MQEMWKIGCSPDLSVGGYKQNEGAKARCGRIKGRFYVKRLGDLFFFTVEVKQKKRGGGGRETVRGEEKEEGGWREDLGVFSKKHY